NVITKAAYRSRQYELNVEKFPFDDKRVREAVNWAIDMPSIVEAVARPLAVPSDSLLPAAGWGYPGEDVLPNYGYDPDKARELLEEAGFTLNDDDIYEKDGEPLSITITCPDNRYYMDKQMSEVVLNQLGEVGIEADLKVMEWGAFLDEVRPGNFQMTFLGWNQSGADPSLFLDAKVMTDGRGNYANHSDPELDEILKEAQKTTDMDERKELYEEAQVIVNEHAWHVFIDNESLVWIFPDNVKGFEPGPANQSDFWYTKLHFE
ncbi:MAG: ABC transporter substrate-binding protein, partial [Clostridia bacterium]